MNQGIYTLKFNINFDEDVKLGYAAVATNPLSPSEVITFLYEVDDNTWTFHYANGTNLKELDTKDLETWFQNTYKHLEEVINSQDMEEYEFYQE